MKNKLVSVVIPSYNRKHSIEKSIRSVERQTYRPLEIIIVDDNSSDGTAEFLASLDISLPMKVEVHKENKGGSGARNTGISLASGDYIAFLDSDDIWYSKKIELQMKKMFEDKTEFCYTGVSVINEDNEFLYDKKAVEEGWLKERLMGFNCVGTTSTAIISTDLLKKVNGFDETLKSCQDWDLWVRLSDYTKFSAISNPMIDYLSAEKGRITSSGRNRISGHMKMYRKHLKDYFKNHSDSKAAFMFTLGDIFMHMNKPGLARKMFFAAWKKNKFSIRRSVCLFLSTFKFSLKNYLYVKKHAARIENRLRRFIKEKATS